jgi:carbamoyl-phosphate synthase large subunit
VALIRAFRDSLERLGVRGKVVTTDLNPLSSGLYVSDKYHFAPMTNDPGYLDRIEEICCAEGINLIIPTIDDELILMGQARERFAEIGIRVVISEPRTSEICNDKKKTYEFFTANGIPTPQTWLPEELPEVEKLRFPLFIKPRNGRGSVDTYRVKNERELLFFLDYVQEPVVQEYLDGDEYTLDTFVDLDGAVLSVVPRRRLWIRAGVMDKGRTENRQELIDLGTRVAETLNIRGPANIQVRYSNGEMKVFEVNPRFSGGIPLTIAAGADFTEWLCRLALGEKLKPRLGEFRSGLVMMSYEANIFRVFTDEEIKAGCKYLI